MPPPRGGGDHARPGNSAGDSGKTANNTGIDSRDDIDTETDEDGIMTSGTIQNPDDLSSPANVFAAPPSTAVTVERAGEVTSVTVPAGPYGVQLQLLFDSVLRVVHVQAHAAATGVQLRRRYRPISGSRGNRLVIPAAYEPLALQLLDAAGVAYVLTGRRPAPLPLPPRSSRAGDAALLAAVARDERLVVRVGNAVDVAEQIVLVCRAFPALRIVVVVKRVEDARRVAHLLRAAGVAVSRFTWRDRDDRSLERVAVTTYRHAGDERVGLWDAGMVIVHDVADALGVDGREAVALAHRDHPAAPRVVGFARADFKPSCNQYAELMNVYGPVERVVPAPGAVNRDVEYQFVPVCGLNSHERSGTGAKSVGRVKRALVWENPLRNRRVARLAGGLVAGDAEGVVTSFPRLAGNAVVGKRSSVLVVVETGAHARALLHHLPNWYAVGPDVGAVPQPPSWGQPAGRLSPAVCTFDGLALLNIAAYDVVVRADAGTGALPLAPDALVTTSITSNPLLVLDVKDRCDPVLAPFAAKRRRAYDALGWSPAGDPRRHQEVNRFLARHPHGTSLRKRIAEVARLVADETAPAGKG